jgi:putative DNA primase/helicase
MNIDIETIKYHANGQWISIISSLAPQLSEACQRPGQHVSCPCHGQKDGFRLFPDVDITGGGFCNLTGPKFDGLATLMWANGWTFPEALNAVASYLRLAASTMATIRKYTPNLHPKKDWFEKRKQLEQIWSESQPGAKRVREYFEHRGLHLSLPDTLRFHPNLPYYHGDGQHTHYPAMLAQIIRDDEVVGMHRTYLDSDGPGKAAVPSSKKKIKCSDTMSGGSIRLFEAEPDKPLVLCEGIETALAIYSYTKWPVWPCASSTMLEKVELPDSIRFIFIGADKDLNGVGQVAAEKLSRRLVVEGREVQISLPTMEIPEGSKSVDWLDYKIQEVACG